MFFGNIMIRKISIRSLRLGDFSLFSVGLLWLKRLERLVAAKSATWRYKGAIPKGIDFTLDGKAVAGMSP